VANERPTSVYVLLAAAVLAIGIAIGLLLMRSRARAPSPHPALSEEQKAYFSQVVVSNVQMSAAENFLGDTVTYLDAQVTNQGPRAVRELELELGFVDMLNQTVLRETVRPITPRTPPLEPGETRSFRVSFDHMPAEWNQAPPAVKITFLEF
jgi:hypothetical protein